MSLRIAAHLLSMALLVPQALIFAAIVLLGHVTAKRTFTGLVTTTLDTLDLLLGWGGIAVLLLVVLLIVAGFRDRWRIFASWFLLAFDLGTATSILVWAKVSTIADGAFLLLPGTLAAALCVWLIRAARTARALSASGALDRAAAAPATPPGAPSTAPRP
jgi:hypothetical protein